eukprot:scaffold3873_cov51-Phaeocystis_antarctica.AAC.1
MGVCEGRGGGEGGAVSVRARVVACACDISAHLLQREAAAARGGEVFRAEAHRVAVAPERGWVG